MFIFIFLADESKLNSGSWEDPLPSTGTTTTTATHHNNNANQNLSISASAQSAKNGNITTTTAQLHNLTNLRRPDTLATARHNLQPLLIQPANLQQQHHQQHSHNNQHSTFTGRCTETAGHQQHHQQQQHQHSQQPLLQGSAVITGSTIAGGNFNANGGSTAVGSATDVSSSSPNNTGVDEHLTDAAQLDFQTKSPLPPNSSSEDEELINEEELNGSVTSSLSATNQRNSQLRSTFNRAKQHLSFDKWRSSSNANSSTADTSSNSSTSSSGGGGGGSSGTLTRRASTTCATTTTTNSTMPTAHQPPREDITTPGETPGGRLSRWFSIRRGSSHQYDVGGRDGRQSNSSSIDLPDAVCDSTQASPQKLTNSANSSKSACKMPGVPEVSKAKAKETNNN